MTLMYCDISNNMGCGVCCVIDGRPIINYNNITGNYNHAVGNYSSTYTVNAEYNWWGDSTGPYHDSLNPVGQGDSVSDYVDFDPWLTEPWTGIEEIAPIQNTITRLPASPNPFRKEVRIVYNVDYPGQNIELSIYDINGRKVKNFCNLKSDDLKATLIWEGKDNKGNQLSNGVYFIKLTTDTNTETRKILLVR